jgi:hypothetical protein
MKTIKFIGDYLVGLIDGQVVKTFGCIHDEDAWLASDLWMHQD